MTWFPVLIGVLLFLVGVGGLVAAALWHRKFLIAAGVFIVLALLVWTTFRIVPPGHRGVYLKLGAVEDRVAGEGFTFITPLVESLVIVDVRVTPHEFKAIEAASRELLAIRLTGKLNFHLLPDKVNYLYQTVGLDFPNKILDPALSDFLKEVAPRYSINEVLPKRDEIRRGAVDSLSNNLRRYGIVIDDIYIADISFPAEFNAAIERKQVAEQNVLTESQILAQRKIQADQALAVADGIARANVRNAEGEAQAILLKASAQSKANDMLNQTLTRNVIDFTLVQKLGDKVEVIILPAGQDFLWNLGDIVPKK